MSEQKSNTLIGLLLCGGLGERMKPFTIDNNKVMLEVGEKTLLDIHLEEFKRANVDCVILISNSKYLPIIQHINQNYPNLEYELIIEESPKGTVNALKLARDLIENQLVYVRFGDNFTSDLTSDKINQSLPRNNDFSGVIIFTKWDKNPQFFGVCQFDERGQVAGIVEKPNIPPSNIVVGGLYLFDRDLTLYIDRIPEYSDGSIVNLLNLYNLESTVHEVRVNRTGWVDCGTPEGLTIVREI